MFVSDLIELTEEGRVLYGAEVYGITNVGTGETL